MIAEVTSCRSVNVTWTTVPAVGEFKFTLVYASAKEEKTIGDIQKHYYFLDNLVPKMKYKFEVIANENREQTTIITWPDVGASVQELKIKKVGTKSITIRWKAPKEQDHFGSVDHYLLYWTSDSDKSEEFVHRDLKQLKYVFQDLQPFTNYTISVVTVNAADSNGHGGGPGEPSNVTGSSLPDVGAPVDFLHVTLISKTSISIAWRPPKEGTNFGIVDHYTLSWRDSAITSQTKNLNVLEWTLDNLKKSTKYTISVTTVNAAMNNEGGGAGEPQIITAKTKNPKVIAVNANVKSSTSVDVSWETKPAKGPFGFTLQYNEFAINLRDSRNFTVDDLVPNSYYTFIVFAEGGFSAASAKTWPAVGAQVHGLKIKKTETKAITVKWKAPEEGKNFGSVDHYLLYWASASNKSEEVVHNDLTTLKLTFNDLRPFTNYTIYVVTFNAADADGNGGGPGEPTNITAATLPALGAQVRGMKILVIERKSISFKWRAPLEQNNLGLIDHYQLYWLSSLNKSEVVEHKDLTKLEWAFNDLQPFTNYTISVATVNSANADGNGGGPGEANNITDVTLPDFGAQVSEIEILEVGKKSISFTWKAPKEENNFGSVDHYLLFWSSAFDKSEEFEQKDLTQLKWAFNDLQPFTNYTITVVTVNAADADGNGGGPGEAANVTAGTLPDAGNLVANLTAYALSNTSISVSWEAPEPTLGNIVRYQLRVIGIEYDRSQNITDITALPLVIRDLHIFSTYNVSVVTVNEDLNGNGGGPGAAACAITQTFPGAGVPVKNLTAYALSNTSISISWESPDNTLGNVVLYQVTVNGEGYERFENITDITLLPIMIEELGIFSMYDVSVVTVNEDFNGNGGGPGETAAVTTQTLPGGTFEPEHAIVSKITSTSISVTWEPPSNLIGQVEKYYVSANKVMTKKTSCNETCSGDVTEKTLTGLDGGTAYNVSIQAVIRPNIDGLGGGLGKTMNIGTFETPIAQPEEDFFTPGVIAGIAIGCIAFVIIVVSIIYCAVMHYKYKKVIFL